MGVLTGWWLQLEDDVLSISALPGREHFLHSQRTIHHSFNSAALNQLQIMSIDVFVNTQRDVRGNSFKELQYIYTTCPLVQAAQCVHIIILWSNQLGPGSGYGNTPSDTSSTLPTCLPWMPTSEVTLDGGSEANATRQIDPRDQSSPPKNYLGSICRPTVASHPPSDVI